MSLVGPRDRRRSPRDRRRSPRDRRRSQRDRRRSPRDRRRSPRDRRRSPRDRHRSPRDRRRSLSIAYACLRPRAPWLDPYLIHRVQYRHYLCRLIELPCRLLDR